MNDLRQAAQAALDAMVWELGSERGVMVPSTLQAMDDLRDALAAPAPEPVAWMTNESSWRLRNGGNRKGAVPVHKVRSAIAKFPLYASAPPQAQPDNRPCTCHPDDHPPQPCAKKYALAECKAQAPQPIPGPTLEALTEFWQGLKAPQPVPPRLTTDRLIAIWHATQTYEEFGRAVEREVRRQFGIKEGGV